MTYIYVTYWKFLKYIMMYLFLLQNVQVWCMDKIVTSLVDTVSCQNNATISTEPVWAGVILVTMVYTAQKVKHQNNNSNTVVFFWFWKSIHIFLNCQNLQYKKANILLTCTALFTQHRSNLYNIQQYFY